MNKEILDVVYLGIIVLVIELGTIGYIIQDELIQIKKILNDRKGIL